MVERERFGGRGVDEGGDQGVATGRRVWESHYDTQRKKERKKEDADKARVRSVKGKRAIEKGKGLSLSLFLSLFLSPNAAFASEICAPLAARSCYFILVWWCQLFCGQYAPANVSELPS